MSKRMIVFLILVIPLYYLISLAILIPIALILPPDIIVQLIVFVPPFLWGTAVVTSKIIRQWIIPASEQRPNLHRLCLWGTAGLNLSAVISFVGLIVSGYATAPEAFVVISIMIIVGLGVLATKVWQQRTSDG